MRATHSVKDYDGSILGYMADGQFVAIDLIRDNIDKFDNLALQKDGVITSQNTMAELNYKDAVVLPAYLKISEANPFQRNIQFELEQWRSQNYRQVLQLGGPRQVGKTTELLKFAYKNYDRILYVNLADDKFDFASVSKSANIWLDIQNYCSRACLPPYRNSRETILIIDEIQTSKAVYNSLRALRTGLNCDIAVTGSYLGIVFHTESFFLPAGTIAYADMLTMSFEEFARVYGKDELLNRIDLYGSSRPEDYDELENLYRIYRQIGGYPEVVKTYRQRESVQDCHAVIRNLLRTFREESRNYFKQPRDVEIFETVYTKALAEMCREKRGTGKDSLAIITELSRTGTNLLVNNNETGNAIIWLKYTGLLCTCDLAVERDIRNIAKDRRFYFSDCGIISYLAKNALADQSSLDGILTETFVFNELNRLFRESPLRKKVAGDTVCFSIYGTHELDFMVADMEKTIYGIEVKTSGGNPLSLKVFIDKHFIDRGIVAKTTYGGHGNRFDTIPIYTVGCRFPYG